MVILAVKARGLPRVLLKVWGMENFVVELNSEEEVLREVIEPLLESEGFELLRIKLKRSKTRSILAIFVDISGKENGIVMDQVTDISRLLSDVLDAKFAEGSVLKGCYDLEVSSPGLDRPLSKVSHFIRAVGQRVKLRKRDPKFGEPKSISGLLLEATAEGVAIEPDGRKDERVTMGYDEIGEANTIFDYSSLDKNKKKPGKK